MGYPLYCCQQILLPGKNSKAVTKNSSLARKEAQHKQEEIYKDEGIVLYVPGITG